MVELINKPYLFSQAEQQVIAKYYKQKDHWARRELKPIRDSIRKHLRIEQKSTCCYCKNKVGFDQLDTNIEHIVSRDEKWIFGFEPLNLALSCPECNMIKREKTVLKHPYVGEAYSTNTLDYEIIHPYFDRYSDHIRKYGSIYEAKSDKGAKTIEYCELSRLITVERNERMFKAQHGNMAQKILYTLLTPKMVDEIQNALNQIDKILSKN